MRQHVSAILTAPILLEPDGGAHLTNLAQPLNKEISILLDKMFVRISNGVHKTIMELVVVVYIREVCT